MFKAQKLRLTRDLPVSDQGHFGDHDLHKGDIVYKFTKAMYGCIGMNGIGVSDDPDEYPFYEIPQDAVEYIGEAESGWNGDVKGSSE